MLARLVLLAGVLAGCGVAALLVYMLARSLAVLLRHDFTRCCVLDAGSCRRRCLRWSLVWGIGKDYGDPCLRWFLQHLSIWGVHWLCAPAALRFFCWCAFVVCGVYLLLTGCCAPSCAVRHLLHAAVKVVDRAGAR